MRPTPPISAIIPVLDEAPVIDSLLAELTQYAGIEILIVDGGSHDDTVERARRWGVRVWESPSGRARQMNRGALEATGDCLLFLHADTRLPPTAVEAIREALASGRCWGRFDVRIEGHHPMLPVIAAAMNWRSRFTGLATGDQAIFMTRQAFEAVEGFPEQPLMEDIEISRHLGRLFPGARQSRPACLRQRVVTSGRRWERDGVWHTIRLMWRLRYRYWRGEPAECLVREYRDVR